MLVLLGVDFRKGHSALRHQDADNSSIINVLLDSGGLSRSLLHDCTGEWFNATRGVDKLDLLDERVWAELDKALRYLVAKNHAEDGEDQVHSSSTLVGHVGWVVHSLLNEGMSESDVLVSGQLSVVQGVVGVSWKLE